MESSDIYQWVQRILDQNVDFFILLHEEIGYLLLLITLPLAIFQGFFTLFPFVTLIIIHVLSFGVLEGFLYSWIGSSLGALFSFLCSRYLFYNWAKQRLENKVKRYHTWQHYIDMYGVWVIILLRSIPIMPSNLISFMASLSPIALKSYLWSTLIGNISMLWLLGILSATILLPDYDIYLLWMAYIIFCITMICLFLYRKHKRAFKSDFYHHDYNREA